MSGRFGDVGEDVESVFRFPGAVVGGVATRYTQWSQLHSNCSSGVVPKPFNSPG